MADIIVTKHLRKQYKDVNAINDLSFAVPEGSIYGFLGQNGAGKSTTIRMLLTLIEPTDGVIEIFGLNLKKHRKEILRQAGAVIERPDLYRYLSAFDNLEIFSRMSGVRPTQKSLMAQLERVGLVERAESKVKTYSQGMKQRLGIAIALINDPALVMLDEPMNGLDPQGIADVRNLILYLGRELKKTVFISSHLLAEMELIADAMLIIDKGKKVAEGSMNELFDPAETIVELEVNDAPRVREQLRQTQWNEYITGQKGTHILFRLHREKIPVLVQQLSQAGVEILGVDAKHSLENYFLSLTTNNQHVAAYTH